MVNKRKDSESKDFIKSLEEIIVKIPLRRWTEKSTLFDDHRISGPDYYSPSCSSSSDDDDYDGFSDSPSMDFWDRRVFERDEFFTYTTKVDNYVLKIEGCRKYSRVTKGYDEYISKPGKFETIELIIEGPENISGTYDASEGIRLFFIDLFQRYSEYKKQLKVQEKKREEESLRREQQKIQKALKKSLK